MSATRQWRPYAEAKAFVHRLHLPNQKAWRTYIAGGQKPPDIPSSAYRVYADEWESWGAWLGTGTKGPLKHGYRSYSDAKAFAHSLRLPSLKAWRSYSASGKKPQDIPSWPCKVYSSEWESWGAWLGTGSIAVSKRIWRPYDEAKAFVHQIHLATQMEWFAYAKGEKPPDIPTCPARVYSSEWESWNEWLGSKRRWTFRTTRSYILSLSPYLPLMPPDVLYLALREVGLIGPRLRPKRVETKALISALLALPATTDYDTAIARIERVILGQYDASIEDRDPIYVRKSCVAATPTSLLDGAGALLEHAGREQAKATNDFATYISTRTLGRLWQIACDAHGAHKAIEEIERYQGAAFAEEIRTRFIQRWNAVARLPIPAGYAFRVAGKPRQPNLMQRLIAYRVLTEKRVGNWSAPGTGKTLGAILASRVINARRTLVVVNYNTLDLWERQIVAAFPDSQVTRWDGAPLVEDATVRHRYVVANYDRFSVTGVARETLIASLMGDDGFDFVVLDEIHAVKHGDGPASQRRATLAALIDQAEARNADLHMLGMSATPVVNTVAEGASLLELVTGHAPDDIGDGDTLDDAIALHGALLAHGVRYRPDNALDVREATPTIDGQAILPDLLRCAQRDILAVEQAHVRAKLAAIVAAAQPGTIIYTHYITGIVSLLTDALAREGLRVAIYTGEDKSGLDAFTRPDSMVDVLIGSSSLREGVDGLQYRSHRVIVASLPWTHAAYEQLIGRVRRPGSRAPHVDIIIPQVVLAHGGEEWSWDRERMARVRYKQTLADAALDGVIPQDVQEKQTEMLARSMGDLRRWLDRAHVSA